jgi:hypothetical protein
MTATAAAQNLYITVRYELKVLSNPPCLASDTVGVDAMVGRVPGYGLSMPPVLAKPFPKYLCPLLVDSSVVRQHDTVTLARALNRDPAVLNVAPYPLRDPVQRVAISPAAWREKNQDIVGP